jgi:UDP-glucose:(heptosyl)LPS alpha-1,3-glucosyltransferase
MMLAMLIYKYFPYGGQQRDFLRIVERCLSAGHQVRVYCLRWEGNVPCGIQLVNVPAKGLSSHTRYQRFSAWVKQDIQNNPVDAVIGFSKMPDLDLYYAADPCFAARLQRENSLIKRATKKRPRL